MLFLILETYEISPYYDKKDMLFTPDINHSRVNYVETYRGIYKEVYGLTFMEDIIYMCGTILSTIGIYYFITEIRNSMSNFQDADKIDCS
jgi:uncharacterized membrane protein